MLLSHALLLNTVQYILLFIKNVYCQAESVGPIKQTTEVEWGPARYGSAPPLPRVKVGVSVYNFDERMED